MTRGITKTAGGEAESAGAGMEVGDKTGQVFGGLSAGAGRTGVVDAENRRIQKGWR